MVMDKSSLFQIISYSFPAVSYFSKFLKTLFYYYGISLSSTSIISNIQDILSSLTNLCRSLEVCHQYYLTSLWTRSMETKNLLMIRYTFLTGYKSFSKRPVCFEYSFRVTTRTKRFKSQNIHSQETNIKDPEVSHRIENPSSQ